MQHQHVDLTFWFQGPICRGIPEIMGFRILMLCGLLGRELSRSPEGPSTQYLRTLVPHTIPLMVWGTRILKYWVLGPSGYRSFCFEPHTIHHVYSI